MGKLLFVGSHKNEYNRLVFNSFMVIESNTNNVLFGIGNYSKHFNNIFELASYYKVDYIVTNDYVNDLKESIMTQPDSYSATLDVVDMFTYLGLIGSRLNWHELRLLANIEYKSDGNCFILNDKDADIMYKIHKLYLESNKDVELFKEKLCTIVKDCIVINEDMGVEAAWIEHVRELLNKL